MRHSLSIVILSMNLSSFHPRIGATDMTKDTIQTQNIIFPTEVGLRQWMYSTLVTAQNLSKAMATKWRIDAVQERTSRLVKTSQKRGPNVHFPLTSTMAAIGMTKRATIKSATARLKTKLLPIVLRFRSIIIAVITKTLPTMVAKIRMTRVNDSNIEYGVTSNESLSVEELFIRKNSWWSKNSWGESCAKIDDNCTGDSVLNDCLGDDDGCDNDLGKYDDTGLSVVDEDQKAWDSLLYDDPSDDPADDPSDDLLLVFVVAKEDDCLFDPLLMKGSWSRWTNKVSLEGEINCEEVRRKESEILEDDSRVSLSNNCSCCRVWTTRRQRDNNNERRVVTQLDVMLPRIWKKALLFNDQRRRPNFAFSITLRNVSYVFSERLLFFD